LLKWLVAGTTLAVLAATAASGAFAGSAPAKSDVSAQFTTAGSVAPQFLSNATTIPHATAKRFSDIEEPLSRPG
jgi:hypothetical protein